MTEVLHQRHRVRHIRDALLGTVAGIQGTGGEVADFTYTVDWDNGSMETRIGPEEIESECATEH